MPTPRKQTTCPRCDQTVDVWHGKTVQHVIKDSRCEGSSMTTNTCACRKGEPCDYHAATCITCHPRCQGHPGTSAGTLAMGRAAPGKTVPVLLLSDKVKETLANYVGFIRSEFARMEIAEDDKDLPTLMSAFHDTDDYPDFDEDPGANYITGCVQGAADALEVSVETLLVALGFNPHAKLERAQEES